MDRRFIQLFKILSRQNDYIKSQELCEQLKIRPRTLREDLRIYKDIFEKQAGCYVKSRPHVGYILHIFNSEAYNLFLKQLLLEESKNQFIIPVCQEERINYIIRYFLSHLDFIKLDDLASEIYVSRSTLNVDIKEVKKRLSYFHLKIISKPSYGVKISGKEKDIRSCIAQYFYHFENYDERYLNEIGMHGNLMSKDDFDFVKNMLYDIILKYAFKLTDIGFQNLTIHIVIAVHRIKHGIYVEEFLNSKIINEPTIELELANEIAYRLNEYFKITLPQSEIHYIVAHLMGKHACVLEEQPIVVSKDISKLIDMMILEIKKNFHIDFSGDLDLYTMLAMHLQPMLNRLMYDMKMTNPLTKQIKKDSPQAFELAVLAGKIIQNQYGKIVLEEELGYLALHFALALERMKKIVKKNIIIVCASGMGTSQILLYKVKSKFKDYINEVLVSEAYKLENMDLSKYDLILSTIPIAIKTSIPIIQVQYFLNEEDVIALEDVFMKNNEELYFIQNCFKEEFFYNDIVVSSRDEAITYMCDKIRQQRSLPNNFEALVFEREALSSTEVGNRIAMPHPIRLVMNETFVAVGILKKPIRWENEYVKFIFLLCIDQHSNQVLNVFNEVLTNIIFNQESLLELERHSDFKTMQKIIMTMSKEELSQSSNSIFK